MMDQDQDQGQLDEITMKDVDKGYRTVRKGLKKAGKFAKKWGGRIKRAYQSMRGRKTSPSSFTKKRSRKLKTARASQAAKGKKKTTQAAMTNSVAFQGAPLRECLTFLRDELGLE